MASPSGILHLDVPSASPRDFCPGSPMLDPYCEGSQSCEPSGRVWRAAGRPSAKPTGLGVFADEATSVTSGAKSHRPRSLFEQACSEIFRSRVPSVEVPLQTLMSIAQDTAPVRERTLFSACVGESQSYGLTTSALPDKWAMSRHGADANNGYCHAKCTRPSTLSVHTNSTTRKWHESLQILQPTVCTCHGPTHGNTKIPTLNKNIATSRAAKQKQWHSECTEWSWTLCLLARMI